MPQSITPKQGFVFMRIRGRRVGRCGPWERAPSRKPPRVRHGRCQRLQVGAGEAAAEVPAVLVLSPDWIVPQHLQPVGVAGQRGQIFGELRVVPP